MSIPDPDQTLGSPKDQQDDWKRLKLSLERPYKDDKGEKIRTLLDIENDKFIYEELVALHCVAVVADLLSSEKSHKQRD